MTDRAITVLTVVSSSHIPQARALARSVLEQHENAAVIACLVDRPPPCLDETAEPFTILHADELGVPDWRRLAFQYDAFELCCAVKLLAAGYLLEKTDVDRLLYLDGDIQVYSSLKQIFDRLDKADIILTPHLRHPLPDDGCSPDELTISRVGAFNAGQIAIRRSAESRKMVSWWRGKASRLCVNDVEAGVFVDQRWLDLVPGLFGRVAIDRVAGHNAAAWNIDGQQIERTGDGTVTLDGEPLVTFHFSGFSPERPETLSSWHDRIKLADQPVLRELAHAYARRLDECGYATWSQWPYDYGTLSDGTPIRPLWRKAVLLDAQELREVKDPFDVAKTPDLVARLQVWEKKETRCRVPKSPLMGRKRQVAALVASTVSRISSIPGARLIKRALRPNRSEISNETVAPLKPVHRGDRAHVPHSLPVRTMEELFPGIADLSVQLPAAQIIRQRHMVLPVAELLCVGAICRFLSPQSVFEIGTFTGSTTLVIAINAPAARIHTLDLPPADAAARSVIGSQFRDGPHAPRIHQHFEHSSTFDFTPFEKQFDLVFIDADHAFDAVRRDTESALRLVRPGGLIIWDDYRWEEEWSECVGVTRCLNEISAVRPCYELEGTRLAIHKVPE